MLETLFSSVILCLILLSVLFCFTEAGRRFVYVKEAAELEAEARGVFSYMEEELRRCDNFGRINGKLYFTYNGGPSVTYEKIGERIVRRVAQEGYIILARYVSRFQVEVREEGCWLYIEMKKGEATWKGSLFIGKRVEFAGVMQYRIV